MRLLLYICNMITIYKITSPTGKIYIGQTKDYRKRMNSYRILNCKTQFRLHNSLKKYGFANHKCEIVEEIDNILADEREQYWITYFKCYWKDDNKGLNLNRGGNRPKHTQETKKKLSKIFFGSNHIKSKKIFQYNLNGEFVKEWSCIKDIERNLNIPSTLISNAAKNSGFSKGYFWSYIPKDFTNYCFTNRQLGWLKRTFLQTVVI